MIIEEIDYAGYEVNEIVKNSDNSLLLEKLSKITLNDINSKEEIEKIKGNIAFNQNTNIKTLSELQKLDNNWINISIVNNEANYNHLQIIKEIVRTGKSINDTKSIIINMYAQLDSIFTILNSLDFTNIDEETKKYLGAIEKLKLL